MKRQSSQKAREREVARLANENLANILPEFWAAIKHQTGSVVPAAEVPGKLLGQWGRVTEGYGPAQTMYVQLEGERPRLTRVTVALGLARGPKSGVLEYRRGYAADIVYPETLQPGQRVGFWATRNRRDSTVVPASVLLVPGHMPLRLLELL